MKTLFKTLSIGLLLSGSNLIAQTLNQADNIATSGGLQSGITSGGSQGNTFYGYRAGQYTTGSFNTIIGDQTIMQGNFNGNTFIGTSAGSGTAGNSNTLIGLTSGFSITGSNNITLGAFAGSQLEGNENIFIGDGAGFESIGSRNIYIGKYIGESTNENDILKIDNNSNQNPLIWGNFANDQLKFNAKVGVGYSFGNYPTTAGSVNISNYNLFVKGGILTEEVRVSLQSTWADYVFKKDYKLPTLKDVENHIAQKGHLINVPSAEEVKNNGIELGEMAKIQQEKIEELTLYIIQQNKLIEKLTERVNKLENK